MHVLRIAVLVLVAATVHVPSRGFSQSSPDEVAIGKVIETWVQAINNQDLPTLLDQFSDDATIDSKIARAKVTNAAAMASPYFCLLQRMHSGVWPRTRPTPHF